LQYYKICALLVMAIIGFLSFVIGGYAAGGISKYLAPYFFFGAEEVRLEKIRVVGYEGGS